MKTILVFIATILSVSNAYTQNCYDCQWRFGYFAGLDFSSGNPIAVTNSGLGGAAVYEARDIVSSIYPPDNFNHYKIYNDDSLCAATTGFRNEYNEDTEKSGTNELQFTVYPNPATDQIVINFYSNVFTDASFELFDVTGRLVMQKNIFSGIENQEIKLPDLASGVYLYYLKATDESLSQGKLIIIKK